MSFQLPVVLEHLTGNIQVKGPASPPGRLNKAEAVGQQVGTLVHNKHTVGIQLKAFFKIPAVIVEGGLLRG